MTFRRDQTHIVRCPLRFSELRVGVMGASRLTVARFHSRMKTPVCRYLSRAQFQSNEQSSLWKRFASVLSKSAGNQRKWCRLGINKYVNQPEEESWQFQSGDMVRCEMRVLSGGSALVAVEKGPA